MLQVICSSIPVWIITVDHRTFAVQLLCMTVHCAIDRTVWPVNVYAHTHTCTLARLGLGAMSGVVCMERYAVAYHVHAMVTSRSASTAASTSQDSAKKGRGRRQVSVLTYKKWQTNYNQEYQTLSWLRCDVNEHDKSLVGLLWCAVCR